MIPGLEPDRRRREDYVAGGRHFWGDYIAGFLFGAFAGAVAAFDFVQSNRGIAACALLSGVVAGAVSAYVGRDAWEWLTERLKGK
jgi:hypothetical protein